MQITITPSPEVCVKCKGRLWCGPKCFILERFEKRTLAAKQVDSKNLQTHSPPGVFVSWHGYPKVNLSPMAPALEDGDVWLADDTDKWFGLSAEKIISFRENLVRGNIPIEISKASNPDYKLLEIQETLMAKKPVGVEMELDGRPTIRGASFSDFHAPMGPQAGLKKFSMTENPSVNPKIDKLVSDTDAKSLDAMVELYKSDVGVNQLHKILSAGMLGVKKKRKFVPTRFAITAIDSNLSEHFIEDKIKYFPQISDVRVFQSNYLENYYSIVLVPREWSYELLEVWKPGAMWNIDSKEPTFMSDFENYGGRTSYAENTAGGYYAVRIAVTEYLLREQKQATAIVFREIGDSGTPSLGVFKCRETARDALKKNPLSFGSLELAMKYLETKLTIPLKFWLKNSKLLDNAFHQKRLTDFA
ncbi:MAG TPA: hypothetical protein VJH23_00620 [archaeon]|nr:hypothetical protein [archaeon]